jgi:hypothetical protein
MAKENTKARGMAGWFGLAFVGHPYDRQLLFEKLESCLASASGNQMTIEWDR